MAINITTDSAYTALNKYAVMAGNRVIAGTGTAYTDISNGLYGGKVGESGIYSLTSISGDPDALEFTELSDLVLAINAAKAPLIPLALGTETTSLTFYPGYNYSGSGVSFQGTPIVLDALGNPNAQFFISSTSDMTFNNVPSITLRNGASNCNVFWRAVSAITFTGTSPSPVNGTIPGIFIAGSKLTFAAGPAKVAGRLYAQGTDVIFTGNGYVVDGACVPTDYVPCFLADAPVLTPSGYKPIASLKVGDLVTTPSGKAPITKVKVTRVEASASTNPYIIKKGAYGATEELLISPNHCVETPAGMIEARQLGLRQQKMTGSFDYYNLELPKWSNMIVAGVTVESLAPITRIEMTLQEFKQFITAQYGAMTPELYKRIQNSTRMLQNGKVSFATTHARKD